MSYINPTVYNKGVADSIGSSNYIVAIGSSSFTDPTVSKQVSLQDLGAAALGYASDTIRFTENKITIPELAYDNTQALNGILSNTFITASYFSILQTSLTASDSLKEIGSSSGLSTWTPAVQAITSGSTEYTKQYYLMLQGTLSNAQNIYKDNQFKLSATTVTITSADA